MSNIKNNRIFEKQTKQMLLLLWHFIYFTENLFRKESLNFKLFKINNGINVIVLVFYDIFDRKSSKELLSMEEYKLF